MSFNITPVRPSQLPIKDILDGSEEILVINNSLLTKSTVRAFAEMAGSSAIGVAPGGDTNDVLIKSSDDNYDTRWGNLNSVYLPLSIPDNEVIVVDIGNSSLNFTVDSGSGDLAGLLLQPNTTVLGAYGADGAQIELNQGSVNGIWARSINGAYSGYCIDDTKLSIRDDLYLKGLEYASDYSGNFNDRSLVDKGYTDAVINLKVDKEGGKSLIANTEIARLAGVANLFDGTFASLAALQAAKPTSISGHTAIVDPGAGTDAIMHIWDVQDGWVPGGGVGASNFADLGGSPTDNTALAAALAAREPAITAGTTAQYLRGDKSLGTFVTDALAAVLSGFVAGAGTVLTTDTIFQALQKLAGNISLKAPLASPVLTGTPTAPTATLGDNSISIATTAFVSAAITAIPPQKISFNNYQSTL